MIFFRILQVRLRYISLNKWIYFLEYDHKNILKLCYINMADLKEKQTPFLVQV